MGTEVILNLCYSWKNIPKFNSHRLPLHLDEVLSIKTMVTYKIHKVTLSIVLVLVTLNVLALTNWEYYLFFRSDKLFIDERVEEDVNDVIKGFYKRGVPLHQIGEESFMVSIDDCMPPFYWGIAEGTGIPDKVLISLNREILKSTTEFRKWVIAHELGHELGYFHEDTLYIMGQYLGKGSYDKAMDELIKKIKNK